MRSGKKKNLQLCAKVEPTLLHSQILKRWHVLCRNCCSYPRGALLTTSRWRYAFTVRWKRFPSRKRHFGRRRDRARTGDRGNGWRWPDSRGFASGWRDRRYHIIVVVSRH